MSTAEEIFNTYLGGNHNIASLKPIAFYEMIKIAQREAVRECAEMCDETEDNRFEHKQAILSFLDQIK